MVIKQWKAIVTQNKGLKNPKETNAKDRVTATHSRGWRRWGTRGVGAVGFHQDRFSSFPAQELLLDPQLPSYRLHFPVVLAARAAT